jgi:hypothetical protein
MVESQCVVCHLREAAHRCIQCHKPTCDECSFKTTEGVFCSRKCATAYRDYQAAQRPEPKKKSPVGKILLAILVLAAVAAVAWYIGTRTGAL